jgi:hypothetical protein
LTHSSVMQRCRQHSWQAFNRYGVAEHLDDTKHYSMGTVGKKGLPECLCLSVYVSTGRVRHLNVWM